MDVNHVIDYTKEGFTENGEFKPVIDRRYPFEKIAYAHTYVGTERKRGNVVITLDHHDNT